MTTNDDQLDAWKRELERQNEELAEAAGTLRALGDVMLEVPTEVLDELAPPTAPAQNCTPAIHAIRL